MSTSSREVAVLVSVAVEAGGYADVALRRAVSESGLSGPAAGRATALAFGSLRLRNRCDLVLDHLVSRPLERMDPHLRAVLRVGVFELLWTRKVNVPGAVHELVDIARRLGHPALSTVANAVLRRVAGEAAKFREPPRDLRGVDFLVHWESHPRWLAQRWVTRFGEARARRLCEADNRDPAVCLRANRLRLDPERLVAALADHGVAARVGEVAPSAVVLSQPGAVEALPGFENGWFTVQDEAAQWVAPLTGVQPGMAAIDLAAAPGGKTTHLAELMDDRGTVLACDVNPARLPHVMTTARRLGLRSITVRPGDARGLEHEVDPVDVVLLDAPCSGTGTLARRPDLRWRLGPGRQRELVALQRELLGTAAALVKPGGVLVYSTCTLEAEENEEQMAWLAAEQPELRPDSELDTLPPGWDAEHAWCTLWPGEPGHDGFFLARRRRVEPRRRRVSAARAAQAPAAQAPAAQAPAAQAPAAQAPADPEAAAREAEL